MPIFTNGRGFEFIRDFLNQFPFQRKAQKKKVVVASCAYTHPLCVLRIKKKKKITKLKKSLKKKKILFFFLPRVSIIFSHANHTFFILDP